MAQNSTSRVPSLEIEISHIGKYFSNLWKEAITWIAFMFHCSHSFGCVNLSVLTSFKSLANYNLSGAPPSVLVEYTRKAVAYSTSYCTVHHHQTWHCQGKFFNLISPHILQIAQSQYDEGAAPHIHAQNATSLQRHYSISL